MGMRFEYDMPEADVKYSWGMFRFEYGFCIGRQVKQNFEHNKMEWPSDRLAELTVCEDNSTLAVVL